MKYDIITAENTPSLVAKVQERIAEGWVPQGGVCAVEMTRNSRTGTHYKVTLLQAMVKQETVIGNTIINITSDSTTTKAVEDYIEAISHQRIGV